MDLNVSQIYDICNMVFRDYISETFENEIIVNKFNMIFSENIYEDYKKYADNNELKYLEKMTPYEIDRQNSLNGMIILPNKINDKFIIIINMNQVNENLDFTYTFAHELTHVCDYSKWMDDNNIKTGAELITSKYYNPIYYWSEFHARYYSYKYAVKYRDVLKEDILKSIKETEFEIHMERLKKIMEDDTNGGVQILTELMYQYGRFIAYKEYGFNAIEEDIFPHDMVKDMFGAAGIKIYYLFENISNYESFKASYNKIVDILEEIRVNFDDFRYRYNKR